MTYSQPAGYLALPATGAGNPILVLHAWWGLNETIKVFCNRLAAAGYVAFAPDLYHGQVADDIPGAEALSSALFQNLDQARAEVAAAAEFVFARGGEPKRGLAAVGFSLGAFYALDLSASHPEHVGAVVAFYGTCPVDYSRSQAVYLGHFAETDEYEPQAEVDALQAALEQAGRPATFYRYPGTGHWFFEPDRAEAYDPAAAELAWARTLEFLKQKG